MEGIYKGKGCILESGRFVGSYKERVYTLRSGRFEGTIIGERYKEGSWRDFLSEREIQKEGEYRRLALLKTFPVSVCSYTGSQEGKEERITKIDRNRRMALTRLCIVPTPIQIQNLLLSPSHTYSFPSQTTTGKGRPHKPSVQRERYLRSVIWSAYIREWNRLYW